MKKTRLFILIFLVLLTFKSTGFGQAPNLGTASTFALFTADGAFTNTGTSLVKGDVGTNLGPFTGFPPGALIGNIRLPSSPEAVSAAADVISAYNTLSLVACGVLIASELAGQTLFPGVSCQNTASPTTLNGTLTLSGAGVYIIKLNSALTTATNSNIILTNGATANNVFFQVNGAATLGTGSTFKGTILANGAIFLGTLANLEGRGLSIVGAISLNNNMVTLSLPDLTPIIVLPQANFTATGLNSIRSFIVNVFEVGGQATSSGSVVVTITAPLGFTLDYSDLLTSINVSGGIANPVSVDNTKWSVMSNPSNRQYTLKMKVGELISAFGTATLGFTITRTTANTGSSSNITVNVSDDPTNNYDSNPVNNIYARIITGL